MDNYIVINKKKNIGKMSKLIKNFNLHKSLKNQRTIIWENDKLHVSIDKKLIRIIIYRKDEIEHYQKILYEGGIYEKKRANY